MYDQVPRTASTTQTPPIASVNNLDHLMSGCSDARWAGSTSSALICEPLAEVSNRSNRRRLRLIRINAMPATQRIPVVTIGYKACPLESVRRDRCCAQDRPSRSPNGPMTRPFCYALVVTATGVPMRAVRRSKTIEAIRTHSGNSTNGKNKPAASWRTATT
jgi:hypothetical protein